MLRVILTVVLLLPAYLFMLAPRMTQRWRMKPFLGTCWAHRGLHCIENGIPENSMTAFKMAVKEGIGIELDVHLTKDEKLVVFHDDTLDRVCGKSGRIEEMSFAELKKCYLSGTSERIPLFSEVLRYVDGRVPLLIEVKLPSRDTQICSRLNEQLRGYKGPYLVQSFNSLVLGWLKKYNPNVLRGQLSSDLVKSDKTPHYLFRFCVKYLLSNCYSRPDFISYKLADSHNISLWIVQHLFHAPAAVWTIRSRQAMAEARQRFDMYIFERGEKICR